MDVKELRNNLEIIKKISRYNYNKLVDYKGVEGKEVIESRTGHKTVKVKDDSSREVFLHSKYDPIREAEKFIEQQSVYIEENNHILFYGVGLGYHIDVFKSKYPDKFWSIYEPDIGVFKIFMETRDFFNLFNWKFKYINIEVSDEDRNVFLANFADLLHDGLAIVTLPSYENVYREAKAKFDSDFLDKIKNRKQSVMVEAAFAKRWVINSLMNLPYTFTSQSMLTDYAYKFRDKPIIIVSAGPSLQHEYDNLRKIKEKGLSYIFAVGSANKALINNNIYPDLVTSYDPQSHNYMVYQPIIDKQIDSIPMAYGTSVGFETMMEYPGKLIHMITSQDTVSPYYLKRIDGQELEFINDAPTIAVVTLQLAIKMQASKIYLVGQNLAFLEDLRYAESVHAGREELIKKREVDIKNEESAIDVYGNEIKSSFGFNKMRQEMEAYISMYKVTNIYNTTKGGAIIEGAPFISLDEVIKDKLKNREVHETWFSTNKQQIYDDKYLKKRIGDMDYSIIRGRRQLKEIFDLLEEIKRNYERANAKNIRRFLTDFDRALDRFQKSDVWKVYVERIVRVYTETVNKKSHEIVAVDDFLDRARLMLDIFPAYILQIKLVLEELAPVIKDNHVKLERLLVQSKAESNLTGKADQEDKDIGKLYLSDSRIIKYEGDWQDHNYLPTESRVYELGERFTSEKGAKVSFRFTGSILKIYSSKREDRSKNIRITVNGVEHKVSQKDSAISLSETPDIWSEIFAIGVLDVGEGEEEEGKLIESSHLAEIELLDNDIMSIMTIELDSDAVLLHPDEVNTVDELEIGKRIRCHYKANRDEIGKFSRLGFATKLGSFLGDIDDKFISYNDAKCPNGYFYFKMVDYDKEGRKLLVADQNIQYNISWVEINKAGMATGRKLEIDDKKVYSRLLDGGRAYLTQDGNPSGVREGSGVWPVDNEWDKYIGYVGSREWNSVLVGSWTKHRWLEGLDIVTEDNLIVFRGEIYHRDTIHYIFGLEKNYKRHDRGYRPVLLI